VAVAAAVGLVVGSGAPAWAHGSHPHGTPTPEVTATPTQSDETTAPEGTPPSEATPTTAPEPTETPSPEPTQSEEPGPAKPTQVTLSSTCGPLGPVWKVTNPNDVPVVLVWIDLKLNGNFGLLGPGASMVLNSHARAVLAAGLNAKTGIPVLELPAFGFSTCAIPGGGGGVGPLPTAPPAAAPVPVPASPHFTG
jgi:hypothetical protein